MKIRTIIAAVAMATATIASTASPVSATDREWSRCPEITDSVVRLYSAYFLRPPDDGGFNYWAELWGSGEWDLPRISAFFSDSPEFQNTYGNLSNAAFVELVYDNVFDRAPDADGLAYWTGQLATGTNRGHMMLLFSESQEYYDLTGTTPFYGGPFKTLPRGAKFWCGSGEQVVEGVSYSWRSDVWATTFAEALPSDDGLAGGNFIVKLNDANLNLVHIIANHIVHTDRPTYPRRVLDNYLVTDRSSFRGQPTQMSIEDADADEMRWWVVIFPASQVSEPFPGAQMGNG